MSGGTAVFANDRNNIQIVSELLPKGRPGGSGGHWLPRKANRNGEVIRKVEAFRNGPTPAMVQFFITLHDSFDKLLSGVERQRL